MKRLLAAVLAACMLLAGNVFVMAQPVVGQGGSVDFFNPFNTSVPINVKVLDQSARYAVDVEFPDMTVTFSESPTWNVNTKKYEFPANTVAYNTFSVKVINHSDRAIAFEATPTSLYPAGIVISCTVDKNLWQIAGLQSGDTEKFKKITVTANPVAPITWEDIIPAFIGLNGQGATDKIGNMVITVRAE